MYYVKAMITAIQRERIGKKLAKISASAKDKIVYRTRYGIDDGITRSNEEVGRIFNMTGEAVRQILIKIDTLING